jgi:hypothetical protein
MGVLLKVSTTRIIFYTGEIDESKKKCPYKEMINNMANDKNTLFILFMMLFFFRIAEKFRDK